MKKLSLMAVVILSLFFAGCSDSDSDSATTTGNGENPSSDNSQVNPGSGTGTVNTSKPAETAKLIFIHHSCGNNWLAKKGASDYAGNLGNTLADNNYYVRDTYYGWDAPENDDIGSHTDTSDWKTWFTDTTDQSNGKTKRDNIMGAVYSTDNKHATYDPITDPGGENNIIMFKSCYPNSEVGNSIDDEKTIYTDLLTYFKTKPNKLFILVTPPGKKTVNSSDKTKELCNWLVDEKNGWLKDYTLKNVGVFDFYCVLSETDSHHTVENGSIVHKFADDYDGTSPYHKGGDGHPNKEGNVKSTKEFIPLLNYYYNRWKS